MMQQRRVANFLPPLSRNMNCEKAEYAKAKSHVTLTTSEVVRMLRELKGWTQEELARRAKLNARTIGFLENKKTTMSKRHAESLAKAFAIHPAIIMFPEHSEGNQTSRITNALATTLAHDSKL